MSKFIIDIESQQRIHFLNYLKNDFTKTFDSMNHLNLDLSDFGNALGNVLRHEYVSDKMGFTVEDFINGLQHGLFMSSLEMDLKNPNNKRLMKIKRNLK